MKFALLGDHPDGLALARALVHTGRHDSAAYCGPATGAELLRRWQIDAKTIGDMEEVLADPAIGAVIVAGPLAIRPEQLRRAVQSERHVLCVHPADDSPNIAYESSMIQADTGKVMFPILPEALHPAFGRLAELYSSTAPGQRFIDAERSTCEGLLLDADSAGNRAGIPGWGILRRIGGEIVEVSAYAAGGELPAEGPLLLAGRYVSGDLFQTTFFAGQRTEYARYVLRTAGDTMAELHFPEGFSGPAKLSWRDAAGTPCEETWDRHDPWPAVVLAFEETVQSRSPGGLWQNEIRALELDDAARRSVEKRRASTLEYQEVSEEVGFKGTMTLVGCGLLWLSLVLLILSVWVPWAGWLILPVIGLFLLMQLLRRVVPPPPGPPPEAGEGSPQAAEETQKQRV